jgi:uncharacterized phage-associated protein
MPSIDSIDFAKYILKIAKEQRIVMDETKLHKLLYICDGYMLGSGVDVITESPRAWNYGPVYPSIHVWLEETPDILKSPPECPKDVVATIEKIEAAKLTELLVSCYGKMSSTELSVWTHQPGGPWEAALLRGTLNDPISKKDMREYFKTLIK